MNAKNIVEQFQGFLGDVNTELKKCSWPSRSELLGSTGVVIVALIILGLFVTISDTAFIALLKLITGQLG